MHNRLATRAAAAATTAALAALATAGGGSAAHAAGSHDAPSAVSHAATSARAVAPSVTLEVTKQGVTPSSRVTAGNTVFSVRRAGAGGSIEIVSLRGHYTIKQALADGSKIFSGDVEAVRRIDQHVVFHGGVAAPKAKGDAARFGLSLRPGSYWFVNLDKGTATRFAVRGPLHRRALPPTSSTLDYVGDMRFSDPGHLRNGWVLQHNRSDEPHFTDVEGVKPGTSRAQVRKYFDSGAQGRPSFATGESHGNLPLSPGQSFVWLLRASDGPAVVACWWPSDENGEPHALMGMWRLTDVRG